MIFLYLIGQMKFRVFLMVRFVVVEDDIEYVNYLINVKEV